MCVAKPRQGAEVVGAPVPVDAEIRAEFQGQSRKQLLQAVDGHQAYQKGLLGALSRANGKADGTVGTFNALTTRELDGFGSAVIYLFEQQLKIFLIERLVEALTIFNGGRHQQIIIESTEIIISLPRPSQHSMGFSLQSS